MVVGYHLVISAYGFWLPNVPRGSGSYYVGSDELYDAGGKATQELVTERRSYAADPHDREKRLAAKAELKYPPVLFTGIQARAIGNGIGSYVKKNQLPVWACAILPDHLHFVIGRFRLSIEQISVSFKQHATQRLMAEGIHPFRDRIEKSGRPAKCFAVGEWKGFLNADGVAPVIQYVNDNPIKAGLPAQKWNFVTEPNFE